MFKSISWRLWAMLAAALALSGCGMFSSTDPKTSDVEKLYADARDDMSAGSWDRAITALERIEGLAAGTLLAQQALLDQGYVHWKTNDRTKAMTALDRFVKLYPSSPTLDYALYMRGVVNFNDSLGILSTLSRQNLSERDQQASRDAHQAFRELVEQFPDSKYAADARLRMDYIVNTLAEYELGVARYYFRRGAFVAAANRAQHALREFQQAPANEEALYILASSYDKLGLPQLRDDADRVLKRNFPNSRYLRDGLRVPERAWWQFW
ncbi:MAG: outer membrane protein assembly factor BamD [Aquabacterium sp.]